MAQVKLAWPIVEIHGSISESSPYYFATRNGKTYLCKKPMKKKIQKSREEKR